MEKYFYKWLLSTNALINVVVPDTFKVDIQVVAPLNVVTTDTFV